MSDVEFEQSKTDFQTLRDRFDFLHILDEENMKGIFKVSNLEKTLMREVLVEYDNSVAFYSDAKAEKDEVALNLKVAEQLSFHEDQAKELYMLLRRNRILAEGKAYRKVSVFRDKLRAIVRGGTKAAIAVLERIDAYFKKRSDAIKAALKAKKEAEEAAKLAAEAAKLAETKE